MIMINTITKLHILKQAQLKAQVWFNPKTSWSFKPIYVSHESMWWKNSFLKLDGKFYPNPIAVLLLFCLEIEDSSTQ